MMNIHSAKEASWCSEPLTSSAGPPACTAESWNGKGPTCSYMVIFAYAVVRVWDVLHHDVGLLQGERTVRLVALDASRWEGPRV